MSTIAETTCWLDADNCIVRVTPEWDEFAAANEGPTCMGPHVCGRKLAEFISGDATRMWVEALVATARLGSDLDRPYRCDSPTVKRYMRMRVRPEGELIVMHHKLVREEAMSQPVHITSARTQGKMVLRCSMCNRLEIDEQWIEPDTAMSQGKLPARKTVHVIHTVCADCYRMLPGSAA